MSSWGLLAARTARGVAKLPHAPILLWQVSAAISCEILARESRPRVVSFVERSVFRMWKATAVWLLLLVPSAHADGETLFRENFESSATGQNFSLDHARTQSYARSSVNYGHILRVEYPPRDYGSPRVTRRFDLVPGGSSSATLSFDMKLHTEFEFVRGGKLHGLSGGNGTSGCKPIDPNGWSVRMMWRRSGTPELYVYHQDRVERCGTSYPATTGFTFRRGRWYRIDLQVRMNTAVGSGDGYAALYVDGVRQANVGNLNLTGTDEAQIDQFRFSTFYGGDTPSWAPNRTTYCYFDNFSVVSGLRVSGVHGTGCEIWKQGIYHASTDTCCAGNCGECGGRGCSQRPGGSQSCCIGSILRRKNDTSTACRIRSSAPCMFST